MRALPLIAAVTSALTFVFTLGQKNARAQNADALSQQVQTIFNRCKNAVVKIEASDEHGDLSGTGFFIDPNGTLYTCFSVGGESRDIVVCNGEQKYPATRLAADPRSGIAILKVDAHNVNQPFLPIGKSRELRVASMVMTIAYPMDFPVTPNVGCVGGFEMRSGGFFFATTHIRANVPVQRGEGGAPLLNMNGEAVGVLVSSMDGGSSGCFALPIEAAEKVRKDFMRFGEVRPGWLGIKFNTASLTSEISRETDGSTVEIEDFVENAPAAKSGLEKGDVLLAVGSTEIKTPDDVLNAAFYLTPGDEVPITVWREGSGKMTFNVQPGDHPDAPRHTAANPLRSTVPPMSGLPLKANR